MRPIFGQTDTPLVDISIHYPEFPQGRFYAQEDGTVYRRLKKDGLKPFTPYPNNKNAAVISISFDGKRLVKNVAQIIAKCFLSNPDNYQYVRLKDGDPFNVAAQNLEWVYLTERRKKHLEKISDMGKYPYEVVQEAKRRHRSGESVSKISKDLGTDYITVYRWCTGVSRKGA